MILASLSGNALECAAGFATGAQVVGGLHEITKVRSDHILEIDGKPAAETCLPTARSSWLPREKTRKPSD